MNTLVTGGAGFIGSHIVRALLERGDHVRVLDNFSTGKRENLDGLDVEIIEADLRDASRVTSACRGIETIFHQAAFVSVPQSMKEPTECFDVNVTGTATLLQAAHKYGVKRVVFASSTAVYGDSDAFPIVEETPLRPLSPYATSKRVDEIYGQLYFNTFGLEVVALRYFNVYGPRQRPDSQYAAAVPIFIRRLLDGKPVTIFGDGGQTRDLIFVGDVVRANLAAATHSSAPGGVFNICTGQETRIIDLVEILQDLFPSAPAPEFSEPRAGDIYRSIGSPQLASDLLGFRARTSLEDGLKQTVEWMRQ
ncbi:MAG: SDR family oxidoreductase [Anaerolineaceae bacterium]|nr:MAG: SDR family oxidoreductase [Anaerolineaceae bacterium]